MGLISHTLEQSERPGILRQTNWFWFTGFINLLKFLSQADDRNVLETELLELCKSGIELAFTAVNDD